MQFFGAILRRVFWLQRVAHRQWKLSAVIILLLVGIVAAQSQNVRNSNDTMLFFSEDNIHRQKVENLQADFGTARTTLVVIDAGDPANFMALLEAERYFTALVQNADHGYPISDLTNLGSLSASLPAIGYPPEYTPIDDIPLILNDFEAFAQLYFNAERSATAIYLSIDNPDQSDTALMAAFEELEALIIHMRAKFPDFDVAYTGNIAVSEALRESFAWDERFLYPATALVNLIVLLLAFANLRVALSVLLVAFGSVIMTQGIAGWSGILFASGSASAFPIVLTLTVASLIHVIHYMGKRIRNLPFQKTEAVVLASFRKLTVPIILTHITTGVGFLSLNFADAPAFRAMGNLVAIGLIFSLLLTLFAAPVLLRWSVEKLEIGDARVRAISHFLARVWRSRPKASAVLVAGLALLAVAGLPRLIFDDQMTNNFSPAHDMRVNLAKIDDAMGWSHAIEMVVNLDGEELFEPEVFARVENLMSAVAATDPVVDLISPIPNIRQCLATRPTPFVGEMRDVPPKYLNYCIRSMVQPGDAPASGFFNRDFTKIKVNILLPSISALGVRELSERTEFLSQELAFETGEVEVTGIPVMSAYLSAINTQQMLVGTAIAMFVVSVMIGVFLQSWRLAILSILPNFFPAMAALGIWVWFNTEVGMAASIIAAVTFGIVVDDTIHILYALVRGKNVRDKQDIRRVLGGVTPGVLTTTAALGFGFAFLMLSGFEVNQQLGFLTSITIFVAFLFDIFVLPTLYLWLGIRSEPVAQDRDEG